MIDQSGNAFEVTGDDKDGDAVFAAGNLMEDGNWVRFEYWIDNVRLREYGVGMMHYHGDGATLEGLFLGRDADIPMLA